MSFHQIQFDNENAEDGADYLFRSKKKKAEVKLKKAEKALAKGNTKKAEKKLEKAAKVLGKTHNRDTTADIEKLKNLQAQSTSKEDAQSQGIQDYKDLQANTTPTSSLPVTKPGEVMTLDPVSQQAGTAASGGGGGDLSSMGLGEEPTMMQTFEDGDTPTGTPATDTLDEDGKTTTKGTLIVVIVVIVVMVGAWFLFRHKK